MGQSGSKAPKITPQDRAVLELKLQRDRVQQYQRKLSVISVREHELAKVALSRGEKDKARTALRRRKYHDSLLSKTDGQLENLEQLVSTIEFAQIQEAVAHGLQQGNGVLKEVHRVMNVESVEKLMEETAEAQAAQREIDELLSSQMTAEEEDAVQAELDAIEREQQGVAEAPTTEPAKPIPALPDAPTVEPVPPEQPVEEQPEQARQVAQPARQALPA